VFFSQKHKKKKVYFFATMADPEQTVEVMFRFRPPNAQEISSDSGGGGAGPVTFPSRRECTLTTPAGVKDFAFDRVFAPETAQDEVFIRAGKLSTNNAHDTHMTHTRHATVLCNCEFCLFFCFPYRRWLWILSALILRFFENRCRGGILETRSFSRGKKKKKKSDIQTTIY
jgi:hypothetical protein